MSSRNRPRASMMKDDLGDEIQLWNSIVDKIRKCSTTNKKYEDVASSIESTEDRMREDELSITTDHVLGLEKLHRNGLKLAEEEMKILNEEPDDLIKNLETLISVRAAFEVIDTPRVSIPTGGKLSRNPKRRLDAMDGAESPAAVSDSGPPSKMISKTGSRSGSVAAASVKSEGTDVIESIKGISSDRGPKFNVGTEVFFKNKNKHSEGEGILCQITNVIGDGKQRRYEIQDIEPELDENGTEPQPYRASVQSLVAIPPSNAVLPDLPKGKQVFALYPATTTFYKAELVGMKKDQCRLRFEGEDEKDKELDVDRRYVLDVK